MIAWRIQTRSGPHSLVFQTGSAPSPTLPPVFTSCLTRTTLRDGLSRTNQGPVLACLDATAIIEPASKFLSPDRRPRSPGPLRERTRPRPGEEAEWLVGARHCRSGRWPSSVGPVGRRSSLPTSGSASAFGPKCHCSRSAAPDRLRLGRANNDNPPLHLSRGSVILLKGDWLPYGLGAVGRFARYRGLVMANSNKRSSETTPRAEPVVTLASLTEQSQLDFELEFFAGILGAVPTYVDVLRTHGNNLTLKGRYEDGMAVAARANEMHARDQLGQALDAVRARGASR